MDEVTIEIEIPVSLKKQAEADAERLGMSVEDYIGLCMQKYAEALQSQEVPMPYKKE